MAADDVAPAPPDGSVLVAPPTAAAPAASAAAQAPDPVMDNALASIKDPAAVAMALVAAHRAALPPEAVPAWISTIHNESDWNLDERDGDAGEIGAGQIKPETGNGVGFSTAQLRNPQDNLTASATYFGQKWSQAKGDPALAMTGYNAGTVHAPITDYAAHGIARLASWIPTAPAAPPSAPAGPPQPPPGSVPVSAAPPPPPGSVPFVPPAPAPTPAAPPPGQLSNGNLDPLDPSSPGLPQPDAPPVQTKPTAPMPNTPAAGRPYVAGTFVRPVAGDDHADFQPTGMVVPGQTQLGADVNAAGQGLATGVAGVVRGTGEAVGGGLTAGIANAQQQARAQIAVMDKIDAGTAVPAMDDPLGYQDLSPDQRQQLRAQYQQQLAAMPAPDQTPIGGVGAAITAGAKAAAEPLDQVATRLLPVDSSKEGAATTLARGVGNILPAVAAGLTPAGAAAVAGIIGTQSFDSTYNEALNKGSDQATAYQAATVNGLLQAGIMSVPLSGAIMRVTDPIMRDGLLKTAVNYASHGITMEGATEAGRFVDNYIARETYDPDRDPLEGMGKDVGVNVALGLLVPAAHGAVDSLLHPQIDASPELQNARAGIHGELARIQQQNQAPATGAAASPELRNAVGGIQSELARVQQGPGAPAADTAAPDDTQASSPTPAATSTTPAPSVAPEAAVESTPAIPLASQGRNTPENLEFDTLSGDSGPNSGVLPSNDLAVAASLRDQALEGPTVPPAIAGGSVDPDAFPASIAQPPISTPDQAISALDLPSRIDALENSLAVMRVNALDPGAALAASKGSVGQASQALAAMKQMMHRQAGTAEISAKLQELSAAGEPLPFRPAVEYQGDDKRAAMVAEPRQPADLASVITKFGGVRPDTTGADDLRSMDLHKRPAFFNRNSRFSVEQMANHLSELGYLGDGSISNPNGADTTSPLDVMMQALDHEKSGAQRWSNRFNDEADQNAASIRAYREAAQAVADRLGLSDAAARQLTRGQVQDAMVALGDEGQFSLRMDALRRQLRAADPSWSELPEDAKDARVRLADVMQTFMRFVGLPEQTGLRLVDQVAKGAADGRYDPVLNSIDFALDTDWQRAPEKFFHEAMHPLLDMLLQGQRDAVRGDAVRWLNMRPRGAPETNRARLTRLYADQARAAGGWQSPAGKELLVREAVSSMAEETLAGMFEPKTGTARAIGAVGRFLDGIGRVLHGEGYRSGQDVLRAILNGDRAIGDSRQRLRAMTPRGPPAQIAAPVQQQEQPGVPEAAPAAAADANVNPKSSSTPVDARRVDAKPGEVPAPATDLARKIVSLATPRDYFSDSAKVADAGQAPAAASPGGETADGRERPASSLDGSISGAADRGAYSARDPLRREVEKDGQIVMPGAEASTRQALEKRALEPMRGKSRQKGMEDFALFDPDARKQTDLFGNEAPKPAGAAKPKTSQGSLFSLRDIGDRKYLVDENGSPDLGQITPEISRAIRREAAPIRVDADALAHVAARHGEELQSAGYTDAASFIASVAKTFTRVYKGNDGELLVVRPATPDLNETAVLTLRPASDAPAEWAVKTAAIYRGRYRPFQQQPLWEAGRTTDSTGPTEQSRFKRYDQSNETISPATEAGKLWEGGAQSNPRSLDSNPSRRSGQSDDDVGNGTPSGNFSLRDDERIPGIPGFYSPVARAVLDLKQARGTGEQMLAMIGRAAGVKPEEMRWLGLDTWLRGQKNVTRDQVLDYVRANGLNVREVVKSSPKFPLSDRENDDYGDLIDKENLSEAEHLRLRDYNDRFARYESEGGAEGGGGTQKYADYSTPGGQGYRELLITLPPREQPVEPGIMPALEEKYGGTAAALQRMMPEERAAWYAEIDNLRSAENASPKYQSVHWNEPNVLAHTRFSERVADDGTRTLLMDEAQSDWHQDGRKLGYGDATGAVPDAPFKTSWPALVMKRMIRWAVDNGFDRVAWTPGDAQAARYDLSKTIGRIDLVKTSGGIGAPPEGPFVRGVLYAYDKAGRQVLQEHISHPDQVGTHVGKEAAARILATPEYKGTAAGLGARFRTLRDLDLKVGGEGMRAFYDKMLPAETQKLIGRYGAKVGVSTIPLPDGQRQPVHSFDISPAMREAVIRDGMPLFSLRDVMTQQIGKARDVRDDFEDTIRRTLVPITMGATFAMSAASKFANAEADIAYRFKLVDEQLQRGFTPLERRAMWDAMDDQSMFELELRDQLKQVPQADQAWAELQARARFAGQGLDKLTPEQRDVVVQLDALAKATWQRLQDRGLVNAKADGLPFYTPRFFVALADGKAENLTANLGPGLKAIDPLGLNLSAAGPRTRDIPITADALRAMRVKYGGDIDIVRDVRTLPVMLSREERAVAGVDLVRAIKAYGDNAGLDLITATPLASEASDYRTIDHPAMTELQPLMTDAPDGSRVPRLDADGEPILTRVPLKVHVDFEGPLRAVLRSPPSKLYKAALALKSGAVQMIMISPLIHNAVEFSRALPALPGKVATFQVYFDGYKLKRDADYMSNAISNGLRPIGGSWRADISGIYDEPNLKPGRSALAKALGAAGDVVRPELGDSFRRAVDAAGHLWHQTLLWDRIADLQVGIYDAMQKKYVAEGYDPKLASTMAGHLANRYAGVLPREALSNAANVAANLGLFSRSYTLGNLGAMKDMLSGMPSYVRAPIEQEFGKPVADRMAISLRRKAIAAFVMDLGLFYVGNSLLQDASRLITGDQDLDDVARGYVRRMAAEMQRVPTHPWELLNPFGIAQSLTSTNDNEPGHGNRIATFRDADGTMNYVRNPFGKIGEDMADWITTPAATLHSKMSSVLKPLVEVIFNTGDFGKPVYDTAATGVAGWMQNAERVVMHIAGAQLPVDAIKGAIGAFTPGSHQAYNALKAFGPLIGAQTGHGYPGGPEEGVMAAARRQYDLQRQEAVPAARAKLEAGDEDGARQTLTNAGLTAPDVNRTLNSMRNPARGQVSLQKQFGRIATPDQQKLLHNVRQVSPGPAAAPPAPPAPAPSTPSPAQLGQQQATDMFEKAKALFGQ